EPACRRSWSPVDRNHDGSPVDLDRIGLGRVRAPLERLDRHRIPPDSLPGRVEPRVARADVELPPVPRALEKTLRPDGVLPGPVRLDAAEQVALAERPALVRAAVTEREVLAVDEEAPDLTPRHGHELVAARLD